MRIRLVVCLAGLCLLLSNVVHADELYTLSVDASSVALTGPGSSYELQFKVPSILTSTTNISGMSLSFGPAYAECGDGGSAATVRNPATSTPDIEIDWVFPCVPPFGLNSLDANFLEPITSEGIYDVIALDHNDAVIGTLTISSVPEPPAAALLGLGLLALLAIPLVGSRRGSTGYRNVQHSPESR